MEKFKVVKTKASPFVGSSGEEVLYYWVTADRSSDGTRIQFGTKFDYSDDEGKIIEVSLIKSEGKDGVARYKEVA